MGLFDRFDFSLFGPCVRSNCTRRKQNESPIGFGQIEKRNGHGDSAFGFLGEKASGKMGETPLDFEFEITQFVFVGNWFQYSPFQRVRSLSSPG